jgi:hypothetical protein
MALVSSVAKGGAGRASSAPAARLSGMSGNANEKRLRTHGLHQAAKGANDLLRTEKLYGNSKPRGSSPTFYGRPMMQSRVAMSEK